MTWADVGYYATVVVVTFVFLPAVIYRCAKLGAYGWQKGKLRFEEDHPKKDGRKPVDS